MKTQRPSLAKVQLTVDVVVFTLKSDRLQVLLVRRADKPFAGQLSLPGGFVWDDETAHDTAARILKDKAGVSDVYLDQLYTFDAPQRDPRGRVVSVAHFALAPFERLQIESTGQTQEPALYDVAEVSGLAFDHGAILAYAIKRLRSKLGYTNSAYSLLPEQFTFYQLQRLYEAVLGRELDKRNFRKKFMSLGLIELTGELTEGARHRPAQYYRFINASPMELPEPAF
jgi:8-oxo-dGTP diphosphatase